jgi:flavodoxin I
MKSLVIYDSVFGNTEKVALAIGAALGEDTPVQRVGEATPTDVDGLDILIVGSPTRGFRPTPAVTDFLSALPADALKGVRAAAFDTRIPLESIKNRFLRFLVKSGGYADRLIEKSLIAKGAILAVPSGGFVVLESEGPLAEGELERAAEWASSIL